VKTRKTARIISLVLSMLLLLATMPVMTAFAIAEWTGEIPSKEEAGVTFRLGVISDTHIGVGETTGNNLDVALSIFENLGDVDAVAMNGDMTYAPVEGDVTSGNYIYNEAAVGLPAELYGAFKGFVEASEFTLAGKQEGDVFTTDTEQGKPVIYSMGNHEFPLNGKSETIVGASKQLFTEQTGRNPGHVMNIGGYTFIVGEPADYNLSYLDAEAFVKEQILAAEAADPSNRPIFYLQHEGIHQTVSESLSSASDNTEEFKSFLQEHPRVVVFSGHTHAIIENPRNIWQDGFTAIATSKTGGGSVSGGGSASYSMGANNTGSQALMLDLTENKEGETVTSTDVSVYRMNLLTGKLIGEPYTFSIDGTTDTFRYNETRYEAPSIAKANDGAALTIDSGDVRQGFTFTYHTDDYTITPGEAWLQDDFVLFYRVVVENLDAGVRTQNFKVFSDIFEPEASQLDSYSITLSKQLDRATNYKISVYALTPFTADLSVEELKEKGVTPVSYEFTTSDELTAADLALLRTHEDVNVALNKPIIAGNPNNQSEAEKLNDGSYVNIVAALTNGYPAEGTTVTLPSGEATATAATSNADDWFMIDLGRRYAISEVKVWPRSSGNVDVYMQNFTIEASNTETFTDAVPLGKIGTEGVTDEVKPIVINGDGNAYRYIRLKKTGGTFHVYSEIEVFASMKAQEVSRNRNTWATFSSPATSAYGSANIVDGTVHNPNKIWLIQSYNANNDALPWVAVVDLERDYPLGMIEMFSRSLDCAATYRSNWQIWGFTDADGTPVVQTEDGIEADLSAGDKLYSNTGAYPNTGLKLSVSSKNKYRYLAFAKTRNEVSAVSEIRAEVLLPQITKVSRKSETEIGVSFTEKMDLASLTAEGAITVKTTGGETLTPTVTLTDATAWDGGYDVTLTFAENLPTSGMTLTIDGSVKDVNGISLVQDVTENISGKVLAINKSYSIKKENTNVALGKTVIAGNPNRTDATKLVDGVKSGATARIIPESYTGNDGISIALPDGNVASAATSNANDWFIVDLGRRYEVSSLVLHPRTDVMADAHMQGFVIEGANTPGFTDKVKLAEVKNGDSTVDGTTALTFPGDGGAYRYIRLRKTANTYHGYCELEVFADMTVTNVARGKAAEVGVTDSRFSISGVTDGKIANGNGWFQSGAPGTDKTPNNLVIDLAVEYPLEMIELGGRPTATNNVAYGLQNIKGYGYSAAAGKPAPLYGAAPQNPTAVLFSTGTAQGTAPISYPFVCGYYRYLALSKTTNAANTFVSEVKAYVVNPAAYSVDINDNGTLTVHFSDKMEVTTLTPENFAIEGVTLSNPVIESGYNSGYDVTFSYSGEIISGMELVVDETVRSQNGVEMAADAVLPLSADVLTVTRNGAAVDSLLANNSHTVTAKFVAEENATAVMFAALKQTNEKLVSCVLSEDTQMTAGNVASFTIEGIVPKSGEKLYVYIWEKSTLRPILAELEVQ